MKLQLLAAAALLGSTSAAHATLFSVDSIFTSNGRSVWTGGSAYTLDTGSRFLGVNWNEGAEAGKTGEVCVPLAGCATFGVRVGAETNGRMGFGYGLKVNGGSYDIQYAGRALIDVPTSYPVANPVVSLGTAFQGLPAVSAPTGPNGPLTTRMSQLQVRGPTAQGYLDLQAQLYAFAGAQVCVVACYGPALGPIDINESRELAAFNRNGDGKIRLLGDEVGPNTTVSALGGLVNASFNLPNLDSSSAFTPGGFNGTTLTSVKRDRVAVLNANVAQIVASAFGLPIPLSGRAGPIGYNLLQANAGIGLDLQQVLSFTPTVSGIFDFTSLVQPIVNGVVQAATQQLRFNFGDLVSFVPPQEGKLGILPTIVFGGTTRNQTSLVLGGNVDVRALGVDVAGVGLGPIVDAHLASSDLGEISIFDERFNSVVGFTRGAPINLNFSGCNQYSGSGEFLYARLCATSEYVPWFINDNVDGTRTPFYLTRRCDPFEGYLFNYAPSCSLSVPAAFSGSPELAGVTFSDTDSAFAYSPVIPTPSTTDGGLAADLAALPDTGGGGPFLIPPGAPIEAFASVPEPSSWTLLLAGFGVVGGALRRSRATTITA